LAFGGFKAFQWKSRAQQKEDEDKYAKWAFPHGQKQRDNLEALMREVEPKEKLPYVMMGFLTCKELFERHLEKSDSNLAAIENMLKDKKIHSQIVKKKDMAKYLALVLADAEIDEGCEYPSAENIRERIGELEKMIVR